VHEDSAQLAPVFSAIRRAGLDAWIDRSNLGAGSFWRVDIKRAIESGGFFLCFFSKARQSKKNSVAHSELLIAVDQLMLMPFGSRWFIPVRVDDCDVPDIPLFGNETIRSLQWIDLFLDFKTGMRRILESLEVKETVIEAVVGERRIGGRKDLPDVNESFLRWFFDTFNSLSEHLEMHLDHCIRACEITNREGLDQSRSYLKIEI
jgi:hypothetical protein